VELERQGVDLRIFSLKHPTGEEADSADRCMRSPVIYLPERVFREPARVFRSQLGVILRHPRGYFRTLLHVIGGRDLSHLGRGLRRFCQTCCLVHEMGEAAHLHAHFANDPTRLASWARMICGISYSVTTHAKDLYQDERIGSPGLRYKLSHAGFIVANSDFSAAGLRDLFQETPPPKIVTIRNGVDLPAFPLRTDEPSEPCIVSAGRLVEKKGFADLIKACQLLKQSGQQFQCEIIGSGPLRDSLRDQIATLGLKGNVALHGQMSQQKLREHLRRALVFALPCVVAANGDRDLLPNVLKEAMATGVPVVSTRLGGIEELITDQESGLLVQPGDPKGLAETLGRLLIDGALRSRLAAQARKVIEEDFDLQINFAKLRVLLMEAVGKPSEFLGATGLSQPALRT